MPDNLVNIVFQADTAQLTQAFAKVEAGLAETKAAASSFTAEGSAASAMTVNWTRIAKQNAEAHEFMRGTIGKTAADFKPATAAMRAASVAEVEVAQGAEQIAESTGRAAGGTRGLTSQLRAMRFDVILVTAAIAGAVKAFQEFATEQTADRQLKGILGSSKEATQAMSDLAKSADSENFKASEYDNVAKSLKIAGIQTKDVAADVKALGEWSRSSNVPLATLAKQLAETTAHSVGSLADMEIITEASLGTTQKLTDAYREIPFALEMASRELTINSEKQEWSFKKTSEQIAATQSLANKKTLSEPSGPTSPSDKAFKDFQANIYGAPAVYGFEGSWGQTKLLKAEQQKLKEGYAQMKKEYGPSIFGETQGMVQSGMWSKEDLLAAADRARGQKQEAVTRGESIQKRDMGYAAEDKQRALYAEAVADLIAQTGALADARHKAAEEENKSAQGMGEAALAGASKAAIAVGKKEFEVAKLPEELGKTWGEQQQRTNLEYNYGATFLPGTMTPIPATPKEHNRILAKEQAAKEAAKSAAYDPYIPPVKPQASTGPTSKEGGKVEDPTTHGLLKELLALFSGGG
jgi:hypothetical protein